MKQLIGIVGRFIGMLIAAGLAGAILVGAVS